MKEVNDIKTQICESVFLLCKVPPGCVAPNDWSICSIVGAMA